MEILRNYEKFIESTDLYKEEIKKFTKNATAEEIKDMYYLFILLTGLEGEVGEIANKVKKILRDSSGDKNELKEMIIDEMGDVFWYFMRLCSFWGVSLEDIIAINSKKLSKRKDNGTLRGSGDKR